MSIKRNLFIVISLLAAAANSCKDEELHTLGIDAQAFFNNDDVQIELDGKVLLNESLATNLTTSVAKTIRVKRPEGKHTLKVIVNGTLMKTEVVTLTDNLYIGVQYISSTQAISFIHSEYPFGYD